MVRRGLEAEGRPDEFGLPTFPSRRFVSAGGLTVAHEGLLEYELVDIDGGGDGHRAHALALTLLRSTGMLSRLGMAYRPLPAGPLTPVEGLQLQGRPIEARYAPVPRLRRSLRHGRRRLPPPGDGLRRRGRVARRHGRRPRDRGGRGVRRAAGGGPARGPGVQSRRDRTTVRCRSGAARVGWSTCGAGRSSPSTAPSSSGPSGSPPSVSA